jgi:hypothetical protein
MDNQTQHEAMIMSLSSAASILLFAWQPFPGEYRIGILALMILGIYRLIQKKTRLKSTCINKATPAACMFCDPCSCLTWIIHQ